MIIINKVASRYIADIGLNFNQIYYANNKQSDSFLTFLSFIDCSKINFNDKTR